MKFAVSLLSLSALLCAGCNTLATRRSDYSPSKHSGGPFKQIVKDQSYLSGIPASELRPSTLKHSESSNPLPNKMPAPAPQPQPTAQPPGF